MVQWFTGSLVQWFNGSSGKQGEAERGFGRYAPYRCLITTNASDEPRGSNASMATQTQHVLRIDAKRDYACSDHSDIKQHRNKRLQPMHHASTASLSRSLNSPPQTGGGRLKAVQTRSACDASPHNRGGVLIIEPHSEHAGSAQARRRSTRHLSRA